ncbi:MAG: glycosyltransferase [Bacteroidia bacterium]|nr:glycosyltransferase [Bacteroidia bacterium]
MSVLFLYTELADYFLKCCEELALSKEVHIVRWPVNKEAPFEFKYTDRIKVYDKNNYSFGQLKDLVAKINPSIIICSGWIDKDYLKITKPYFGKIPTVLTCDTHWRGDLKQYLAIILSRFFLLNTFSNSWVPGNIQEKYVRKLGFAPEKIRQGFYCCDLQKFNAIYDRGISTKRNNFPKRFLYVGRYYDFKGITDLWKAFIDLQEEFPNDWELWCLGAGSIEPVKHPKIKHFGFVQPKDLEPILEQTGVFILPSRFEPWGVVVQEYAAAGFPLLISEEVGAGERFIQNGINGYGFPASNPELLKSTLKNIIKLEGKDLTLMAERSHRLAQEINPQQWVDTVLHFLNEYKN